jgi:predicted enzyme related to lactoylglutathione lyase
MTMTVACGDTLGSQRGLGDSGERCSPVMPLALHHLVIDAHDLRGLALFWTQVLQWRVWSERDDEVVIGPCKTADIGICFMPAAEAKWTKNRVHLDLTTVAEDREAEIARLVALGARHVEIGQTGDESWLVFADPEGNEFCVVRPKATLVG